MAILQPEIDALYGFRAEPSNVLARKHRSLGTGDVLGNKWIHIARHISKNGRRFESKAVETGLGSGVSLRPIIVPVRTRTTSTPRVRGRRYGIAKRRFSVARSS